MNDKRRWWYAVAISIIMHVIILIFIMYQISIWSPSRKINLPVPPEEVFIADEVPDDSLSTDEGEENTDAALDNGVDKDAVTVPTKNSLHDSQEEKADKSSKVMSVPETERNNKVAAKKKRPRRYHITSLKGVNLADRIDLSNIPAKPQRIAGKKFVLPAALQSQGHSITVTVIYIIKADGTVEADIEKSSGNEAIDDAAIAAINSWQFKPMNKDYPVPIEHVFTWPDK